MPVSTTPPLSRASPGAPRARSRVTRTARPPSRGTSTGLVASPAMTATPSFSIEAWVKTDTTQGGKIVGYGAANDRRSGSYDRHLYMDNAGHVIFGVYPGGVRTVSTAGTLQRQQLAPGRGDARQQQGHGAVRRRQEGRPPTPARRVPRPTSGYWRIGGDNLNGWPSQPASNYIRGTIDDVAIYPSALDALPGPAALRRQWTQPRPAAGPDRHLRQSRLADSPDLYWRLGDASRSDGEGLVGPTARRLYSGGETFGQPGAVAGTSDTAVLFDGTSGPWRRQAR